jgi:hypothetical protein
MKYFAPCSYYFIVCWLLSKAWRHASGTYSCGHGTAQRTGFTQIRGFNWDVWDTDFNIDSFWMFNNMKNRICSFVRNIMFPYYLKSFPASIYVASISVHSICFAMSVPVPSVVPDQGFIPVYRVVSCRVVSCRDAARPNYCVSACDRPARRCVLAPLITVATKCKWCSLGVDVCAVWKYTKVRAVVKPGYSVWLHTEKAAPTCLIVGPCRLPHPSYTSGLQRHLAPRISREPNFKSMSRDRNTCRIAKTF